MESLPFQIAAGAVYGLGLLLMHLVGMRKLLARVDEGTHASKQAAYGVSLVGKAMAQAIPTPTPLRDAIQHLSTQVPTNPGVKVPPPPKKEE